MRVNLVLKGFYVFSIRIKAAFGERVAAEDSPQTFDGSSPGSVFFNGSDEIIAAAWIISAMSAKNVPQGMLIDMHGGDQQIR
jgi:UDP-N-acetylenolpyruvoylglucosamine reductase